MALHQNRIPPTLLQSGELCRRWIFYCIHHHNRVNRIG